jgi:asparagine synthase (glutamine-hydrolysing)
MCGIAGMASTGRLDESAIGARLDRVTGRLAKRGPDGHSTWHDAHCALAHTRLAIIDLSAAAKQPMERDGRVIVFNGEIYNFRALRRELETQGHTFTTQSDTEVLLAGWKEWGAGLLPRITGMFALALWDTRRRELVLARDAFGKKPLLYACAGGALYFGSDLRALEEMEGRKRAVDPASLRLLFALRYIPDPWTIAEGVSRLPAGHLARFTDKGFSIERWYDLTARRPAPYTDETQAAVDLRARFDASVEARTVSDVPIGAFLSSGIDSALVVASLVRLGPVRTFTVGFPGASAYYEERPGAAAVAKALGTQHTEVEVTPGEAIACVDGVFDGFDEPFADSSALPTYLLSRATRKHVTVALSGDGADEAFAGYRKHQGELYAARYARLPASLRRAVIEPLARALPAGKNSAVLETLRRGKRFLDHAGKDGAGRQAGWMRLLSESELDALVVSAAPAPTVEELVARAREEARETDPINAMLAAEVAIGLPGDMLVKVDRMSMANSLEVRCPWLDRAVVECAAAMPGPFKLAPGAGKRIVRRAFQDRLPAEVFTRPKKGFEMPVADWLRRELKPLVDRAADPARLAREGLLRPALPERWRAEHAAGRDRSWELWTLLAFQSWLERRA